jgi:hypothetical protein
MLPWNLLVDEQPKELEQVIMWPDERQSKEIEIVKTSEQRMEVLNDDPRVALRNDGVDGDSFSEGKIEFKLRHDFPDHYDFVTNPPLWVSYGSYAHHADHVRRAFGLDASVWDDLLKHESRKYHINGTLLRVDGTNVWYRLPSGSIDCFSAFEKEQEAMKEIWNAIRAKDKMQYERTTIRFSLFRELCLRLKAGAPIADFFMEEEVGKKAKAGTPSEEEGPEHQLGREVPKRPTTGGENPSLLASETQEGPARPSSDGNTPSVDAATSQAHRDAYALAKAYRGKQKRDKIPYSKIAASVMDKHFDGIITKFTGKRHRNGHELLTKEWKQKRDSIRNTLRGKIR